ncbi:MAG: hypothetical protein JSU70_11790 [Phycisphaerales bacterium]|nr:MAG: hypothetical protein JSU70_11790 [Phycisphaerales bacterium]
MSSPRYARMVFACATLAVGLASGWAQSSPGQPGPEDGSVLDVGRANPFAAILRTTQPTARRLSQQTPLPATEEVPELFLETVTLKFLDAKNLETVVSKMVSRYGSTAANLKNNSLIICDTRESLTRILTEIRKADKTPQQLTVEVVILDVELKDDTEIGINWDLLSTERFPVGYRQNFTTARLRSTAETAATVGNATAFNTVGLGGDFSVIIGSVRNVLHMIQQKRNFEIIASPRTMVVSGQTANIKAVEEIPYTEITDTSDGGAMALTSTQFKEVGVNLQVTATITDGNDILLTVDTEQNVKTGETEREVPVVDTRKANTSLVLKDGQVVVIGGLRREQKTKEVDQIPIVGDFPIVGELFKNRSTIITYSELVVLVSPHIYKGEPVPKEAKAKYEKIRNRPMLSLPKENKKKKRQAGGSKSVNGGPD